MAETPLPITQPQSGSPESPSVVEVLSDAAKNSVLKVQDYSKLALRSLTNLATPPRYMQDTLVQMDDIGVGSLPIVLLSGFFIGAVLVLQTGAQFERFGQTMLTGDVVSIALVRELKNIAVWFEMQWRVRVGASGSRSGWAEPRAMWVARSRWLAGLWWGGAKGRRPTLAMGPRSPRPSGRSPRRAGRLSGHQGAWRR